MTTSDLDSILALRLPPRHLPVIVSNPHASHRIRRGDWVEIRRQHDEDFHLSGTGIVVVRRWWWSTATVLWASSDRTTNVPVRTLKRIPQDIR